MFGFFKKQPLIQGPIEFEADIEIGRSAKDVYRLIDPADPGFGQVALGNQVAPVSGTDDCHAMILQGMEDVTFYFKVLEAIPGERHSMECVMEPRVGNLVKSVETHVFEPRGENSCFVKQTVSATFDETLSDQEVAQEVAMMSIAVQNDLQKLAVHAVEGPEAVKAYDEQFYSDFDDLI